MNYDQASQIRDCAILLGSHGIIVDDYIKSLRDNGYEDFAEQVIKEITQ